MVKILLLYMVDFQPIHRVVFGAEPDQPAPPPAPAVEIVREPAVPRADKGGKSETEQAAQEMAEHFRVDDTKVEFQVEGSQDAQVTLQLEEDCEYEVFVDGASIGGMKTNMSGKLVIGVELNEGTPVTVKVIRK